MSVIAANPFVLKDVTLSIEGDSYEAHVRSVTLTPSASVVSERGLTPTAVYTDTTSATWTCDLDYFQDWSDPDSLSYKLHEEEGASWNVTFTPKKGSGQPSITVTVIVTPGAIGGAGQAFATATVQLGVIGKPEIVPAV